MCLTFDTTILVHTDGIIQTAPIVTLALASDHHHLILGLDGDWHRADFHRYGEQPVFELALSSGERLFATEAHEWIVDPPHFTRLTTLHLKDHLLAVILPNGGALDHPIGQRAAITVTDIRPTNRAQPVYSCVEPITHSFALGCGVLSGHSTEPQ